MNMSYQNAEALHPGIALKEELEKRGWNQSDLTFVLGCNPKAVNQIVNGKQGISPSMSKALGEALNIPVDFFADLQQAFDLAVASVPDPSISLRARMQNKYPIREMVKRNWLSDGDAESLGSQLADFFGVRSADEIPYLAHAAKKTTYDESEIPAVQLAWIFRVKQIANAVSVPAYSERKLRAAITELSNYRIAPEEARKVPALLAECGVRLVVVEALPGSKIDGVCFWLDDAKPVIGLSMRFDRIDNFWFVLRHEIEHVLEKHGRSSPEGMIDVELNSENDGADDKISEEERVANVAATNFCVPVEKMESFILRKHPFFYEKDVLAFSKINNVHPGLPVGQIQRRLGRYDYLKKYQSKIRQFVLPGAIVDGWGQTMPL
jgi:HTH-type transcriptional regulator / antitoxin HigA